MPGYFSKVGYAVSRFANPADSIIKLAQAPHLCAMDLTYQRLVHEYNTGQRKEIEELMDRDVAKFRQINTVFSQFADARSVGMCK